MAGYGDKLKANSSKINKVEEKVLVEKKKTGRPSKASKSEVRNINMPIAFSKSEKKWIQSEVERLSKEIGAPITMSGWMRAKILADMPKED